MSGTGQKPADAAAAALQAYRDALGRYGLAGADGWLLGYLQASCGHPDAELAAVVRALLWLRGERAAQRP